MTEGGDPAGRPGRRRGRVHPAGYCSACCGGRCAAASASARPTAASTPRPSPCGWSLYIGLSLARSRSFPGLPRWRWRRPAAGLLSAILALWRGRCCAASRGGRCARDIGWSAGDQPLLEPFYGVLCYLAALPVVILGAGDPGLVMQLRQERGVTTFSAPPTRRRTRSSITCCIRAGRAGSRRCSWPASWRRSWKRRCSAASSTATCARPPATWAGALQRGAERAGWSASSSRPCTRRGCWPFRC